MSSEFMPMALDSLARQQSARAAGSGASSRITEEELEELGIPVNKPGENDMGLDFNDFLQLMVQQLQNQTIDNTTDTGEMLNQLVQMSTVQMLSSVKTGLEALVAPDSFRCPSRLPQSPGASRLRHIGPP